MKREKVLDMESRYKLVKVMAERYKRARKKDKGYLLDLVVNSSQKRMVDDACFAVLNCLHSIF